VERYRLVDYDDAKDAMQRGTKENRGPPDRITQLKDKYLQVHFTIETKAPSHRPDRVMIYLRDRNEWPEAVCAEKQVCIPSRSECRPSACGQPDF